MSEVVSGYIQLEQIRECRVLRALLPGGVGGDEVPAGVKIPEMLCGRCGGC